MTHAITISGMTSFIPDQAFDYSAQLRDLDQVAGDLEPEVVAALYADMAEKMESVGYSIAAKKCLLKADHYAGMVAK
jgi:hypothetical protein